MAKIIAIAIYTVKRRLNAKLEIEGILLTMVDNRTNYAKDIVMEVNDVYGKAIPVRLLLHIGGVISSVKTAESHPNA